MIKLSEDFQQARDSFYAARDDIDGFIAANQQLFGQARELADIFNHCLDRYKLVLRQRCVDSGLKRLIDEEFKVTIPRRVDWDVEPLLAEMDITELETAGAVTTQVKFKVDDKRLTELVVGGQISADAYQRACRLKPPSPTVTSPHKPYIFPDLD